jgi:hypothetical protein
VIAAEVALVDHTIPVVWLEVSVTFPPLQNVVGPFAVITGAAGEGLTVTTIEFEVAAHPLAFVTVTV